ncbi:T9SS type A sorting domain-containing protein [Flavobacterium sp. CYK-55]|uniref:zinc-dependent metalloprotease n=1 Tax=Flavobacterium sp. CYK-55 TaxID=2835529 RepID=UPI001BCF3318|nr:zinc-dependent metalloprotease family protein [Flavobacterium sp. CYK-55]MBS7787816.1 T9SS type A sorting domain-containing protein [Flavobacterium sp. CYK-55]
MKKVLFFAVAFISVSMSYAQDIIWKKVDHVPSGLALLARDSNPTEFKIFSLNIEVLKAQLALAPSQNNTGQESQIIIAFPNAQGEMKRYRVYEASVMDPALAIKHSEIQSYVGLGVDDPTARIRFSTTIFGLHTMTLSGIDGATFIDPYTKDLSYYMVFNKSKLTTNKTFKCDVADTEIDLVDTILNQSPLNRANNSLFKTYRLALACTIEYAAFHVNAAGVGSGTLAQKKAAVLAAMVVTMTRVNGVYERDMALRMVLIANNENIINITSDTLDNTNANNVLLDQNQTFIDTTIGSANYDIGHVASTGGGGVATPQSPCNDGIKARGVTGLPSPVGDEYDIDFVAHEMGHQFGCSHTFNGDQGNCGGGNRVQTSAYEPGSGSTIMAYAGICSPQDVQLHSDAYFHARSLLQMISFVNAGGNCAVAIANNNNPPVVNAGASYTIPNGTPFVLTGSATDANEDSLTYCWEQYNFSSSTALPSPTATGGPNFRSFNPTASPKRYFPVFSSVLANNLAPTWEVIPTVSRSMVFSLVVRDNRSPLGGQTERGTMNVTFASVGPFRVTSQSTNTAWDRNSTQTITWDVAGTTANNINTANVNIRLSTDGGATFPYLLAENTPNDGSEDVIAPEVTSSNCRIMVEAVGNIFYALNTKAFYIGYTLVNGCNTYTFNTPFNLNDGSNLYTVKTINVPTAGTISDVNISVNATHPNLQNLIMAVARPGGAIGIYFNQQCSGSSDMNVTFDSQAPTLTCASPTTGTYAPSGTLNFDSFNGFSQQGNWQFGFKDVVAGNAGSINSIALEICTISFVMANNNFAFENFALVPNPNNGDFSVQFNSNSNRNIQISVYDMSGRTIFDRSYANHGLFEQEVRLQNAQTGVYLVSISDGENKMVKRVVVQ